MNQTKLKQRTTLFCTIALLCCALSILMLLIPFDVTKKTYAMGDKYRSEPKYSYQTDNFFSYTSLLTEGDFEAYGAELMFIVSLGLSLIFTLANLIVSKSEKPGKTVKNIAFYATAAFVIASLVMTIVVQCDAPYYSSTFWFSTNTDTFYFTNYLGSYNLIFSIVLMFIAFASYCVIFYLKVNSSKLQNQPEIAQQPAPTPNFAVVNTNNTSNASKTADDLIKFKKLLDDGIITQEEFDAKKKQLLNL